MPFSIEITLFDTNGAIESRRLANKVVEARLSPLSLDTLTGLPAALDLRVRATSCQPAETFRLFEQHRHSLNPLARAFSPRRHDPAVEPIIRPPFSPLRKLDYRFSKITIDWQDMDEDGILKGSIEAGFGIIHLHRDAADMRPAANAALLKSDGRLLAVLAVPSVMNVNDFLFFVDEFARDIAQIRILRDEMPNKCMALMQFHTKEAADAFQKQYHGRAYWKMFEDELCQVVPVSSIHARSTIEPPFTSLYDPTQSVDQISSPIEIPTCVVCLERMDSNITGLITIPCQHTFHCSCLSKWANGKCPVCRYTQSKLKTNAPLPEDVSDNPTCDECRVDSSLWMCLVCGHVGCGRYGGKHAVSHYQQSNHNYAMELETQRIWDYAGDQYVHRLIQNRTDGQLVELPSMFASGTGSSDKERLGPDIADIVAQEKMERMGEEFSHVLSSQLETQRSYYVDKLSQLRDNMAVYISNLEVSEAQTKQWQSRVESANRDNREQQVSIESQDSIHTSLKHEIQELKEQIIPHLQRDKARAESKAEDALNRAKMLSRELASEQEVTRGLMEHVGKLKEDMATERAGSQQLRLEVDRLQADLNEILLNLSLGAKLQNNPELQDGSVSIADPAPPEQVPISARKKKKPKRPPNTVAQANQ